MQAVVTTPAVSDPRVERHFDRSASLYVDHALACYRESVEQRLDLLTQCSEHAPTDPLTLLDIGCGGGAFVDMFLERFPAGRATGLDVSQGMLATNRQNERKTLLQADALRLPQALGTFDAVCVDTVMHHLIARKGYESTQARIQAFLRSLHAHLRPGGVVVIREIYHEYRVVPELGSRLIFELTTLKVPAMLERGMRAAGLQTANVGVCFLTRVQWQKTFREAGFDVIAVEDRVWPGQPYRRFGFTQSGDLHFVLKGSRPQL